MMNDSAEILLIEDDPAHADLTVRVLKKHNISNHIQHLTDGAKAIEFLFSDGPNRGAIPRLILLDLKLPKIDGIEVLRRIKGDPRTKAVPVVMLTSSNEEQDLKACYALGVNSYIVKPVGFQEFSESIRSVGLYWLLLNRLPS